MTQRLPRCRRQTPAAARSRRRSPAVTRTSTFCARKRSSSPRSTPPAPTPSRWVVDSFSRAIAQGRDIAQRLRSAVNAATYFSLPTARSSSFCAPSLILTDPVRAGDSAGPDAGGRNGAGGGPAAGTGGTAAGGRQRVHLILRRLAVLAQSRLARRHRQRTRAAGACMGSVLLCMCLAALKAHQAVLPVGSCEGQERSFGGGASHCGSLLRKVGARHTSCLHWAVLHILGSASGSRGTHVLGSASHFGQCLQGSAK